MSIVAQGATIETVADFLVLATGRYGRIASFHRPMVFDHLCMVGSFGTGHKLSDLFVEAVRTGWWYSHSASDRVNLAGWVTDATQLRGGICTALSEALRVANVTRTRVALESRPFSVSVPISALIPSCGMGWLAVGDAAFAADPLSGDGLVLPCQIVPLFPECLGDLN